MPENNKNVQMTDIIIEINIWWFTIIPKWEEKIFIDFKSKDFITQVLTGKKKKKGLEEEN